MDPENLKIMTLGLLFATLSGRVLFMTAIRFFPGTRLTRATKELKTCVPYRTVCDVRSLCPYITSIYNFILR